MCFSVTHNEKKNNVMKIGITVHHKIRDKTWNLVWDSVQISVWDSLMGSVWEPLINSVWHLLYNSINQRTRLWR